jgi:hypothetical protein
MKSRDKHPLQESFFQRKNRTHKDTVGKSLPVSVTNNSVHDHDRSPARAQTATPLEFDNLSPFKYNSLQTSIFADTTTSSPQTNVGENNPINALTPLSSNTMNTLNSNPKPPQGSPHTSKTPNGTIRTVPSESLRLEAPSPYQDEDLRRVRSRSGSPAHSSTRPQGSSTSAGPPLTWQNNPAVSNGLVRSISSEFGPTKNHPSLSIRASEDGSSSSNGVTSPNGLVSPDPSQWSSAVGRANLGKSGRVIEKLMGENDMLKRDLQIERLRAEESKQAVKMAEGKSETMAAEFESKLHDAAINSTLLKRRERQLAEIKAQVDGEKLRAQKALEREQNWKLELEKTQAECEAKIAEAHMLVKMHEGRANTMENHWKDQGKMVSETVVKLGKEIEAICIERRADDAKILRLETLCKQHRMEIEDLERKNEDLRKLHEKYREERDNGSRIFDQRTSEQEGKTEALLEETKEVAHRLKWALGVQENMRPKP